MGRDLHTAPLGDQALPHQPPVIQCSNRFHSSVLSVDQGTRGRQQGSTGEVLAAREGGGLSNIV